MAVNLPPIGDLKAVPGIEVGVAEAHVRYPNRLDLAVLVCSTNTVAGGVFTQNSYRAAPVELAAPRCGSVRGLVINSGNANAATGQRGLEDAETCCRTLASLIDCDASEVLPFSTGVIGEFLPVERMRKGIVTAFERRRSDGWNDVAEAIMTTDTAPKGISRTFDVQGRSVVATGIVKGSGMIRPNMATMLAYIGTNAAMSTEVAQALAFELAELSFNRLTIDGDTSTNDSFVLLATAMHAGPTVSDIGSDAYNEIKTGLEPIARELAIRTVRDGEGATKFVIVDVKNGRSKEECLRVAYTVAQSPLIKTAIFAGDPNWGRFCMAIGNAGLNDLDPYGVSLHLDDVQVAKDGLVASDYVESDAADVMAQPEFKVLINLNRGSARETVWTSDLSYDYVKINAEYRS